jgi:Fe-S-cluster containining protein
MTRASLGCARCGDCCDPVHLDPDNAAKVGAIRLRRATEGVPADLSPTDSATFIQEHWTELDVTPGGTTYSCDQFDPVSRQCMVHESRPDVCRGYPWYDDEVKTGDRFGEVDRCSYLLELAPHERPPGARPLIPITVAGRP